MSTLATDFIANRAATMVAARDAGIERGRERHWQWAGVVMVCLGLSNGFALWVAASCLGIGADVIPRLFQ
jgi:hypothetical protein